MGGEIFWYVGSKVLYNRQTSFVILWVRSSLVGAFYLHVHASGQHQFMCRRNEHLCLNTQINTFSYAHTKH